MRRASYLFDRTQKDIESSKLKYGPRVRGLGTHFSFRALYARYGFRKYPFVWFEPVTVSLLTAYRDTAAPYMHGNQFFPFCGVCTIRSHTIQSFPHMSQPQNSTVSGLSPAAHERPQSSNCHAASNVQRPSTSATRSSATTACSSTASAVSRAASRARMLGSPLPAPADSSTSSSSPSSEEA